MTEPSITTVGEGRANGTPDALRLHVTVQHRAGSVSEALSGCASRLEAAVGVARRFTDEDRIGSTGLHLDRAHDDRGSELRDWVAQHSLRIDVPDVAASGDLVTSLADTVDTLRIGHVEMYLSDPRDLEVRARADAFADARRKADELAALAGMRVVGAHTVVEGGGGARPFGGAEMAVAKASTSFEPGTATVAAALTVTWTVETS
jgi:uncharacterized protein YggE